MPAAPADTVSADIGPADTGPADTGPLPKLSARRIAGGSGWTVSEFICRAGPDDRPYEESHDSVAISLVAAGSFAYRSDSGRALLHPGSLLLGNAGRCFECGHEHGSGDRCIAVHFDPGCFAAIAASRAGRGGHRFRSAMLPALRPLLPHAAALEALAAPDAAAAAAPLPLSDTRIEEAVIALAGAVLTAESGALPTTVMPAPREYRRIAALLRHMEETAEAPHSLDALASLAGMSKYHFLRCFRRITGRTPYEYLLSLRLRRAAVRLRESEDGIAAIAFEAGFGDLSTFNARFKAVFGKTPGEWRNII